MLDSATKEHGGSFFSQTPATAFSPEQFSADEKLMVDMALQFSRKEILPLAERLEKQEAGLMPSLVAKAGQLGFCGVDTPEQFGGLGLSKNLAARILEHLSLDGSFSVTLGVTSGIAQFGLACFGDDAQKAKYLPDLASGEWIGAYALSEPDSGSDALSLQTRAEDRGDKWVLNGTKMWISNAQWAQFFLVMAKIEGVGVTAFLVEKDYPGVSISREEHKMGLKGSSTARLVLENAEVPKENLLYLPGKGHYVALNALNIGRFKLGAMSLGPARQAITVAADYAKQRKQFKTPISEFGLIRQKFADMAALFFAAESVLYRTGDLIDNAFSLSDGTVESNRKAAEEYAVEASANKIFSTEAEGLIVDHALQCFGGYGFTEEFPIARIYRDARVSRIYEGTNEINRIFLAGRLMKAAEDGKASLKTADDSFVSEVAGRAFTHAAGPVKEMHQTVLGALSDLVLLTYAEQSARLRGKALGGTAQSAYERFRDWANIEAARAYQTVTGEGIGLPGSSRGHVDELATAILEQEAPLAF